MTINLIFTLIARTIISSQSLCLAAAQNTIFVEIGMAQDIVINNVNLTQVADASLSCASTVEIDVSSMQDDISKTLTNFIKGTAIPADADRVTAIQTLSKSFTSENVGACIALAKNSYKLIVEKVGGTFKWENFTLEQYATAQLEKCVLDFIVGEKTMLQYVQEDLLGLKEPTCKDGEETNTHSVIGGILGSIVLILVIATLAVGLSPTKKKQ
jgi:hypothetical protein